MPHKFCTCVTLKGPENVLTSNFYTDECMGTASFLHPELSQSFKVKLNLQPESQGFTNYQTLQALNGVNFYVSLCSKFYA